MTINNTHTHTALNWPDRDIKIDKIKDLIAYDDQKTWETWVTNMTVILLSRYWFRDLLSFSPARSKELKLPQLRQFRIRTRLVRKSSSRLGTRITTRQARITSSMIPISSMLITPFTTMTPIYTVMLVSEGLFGRMRQEWRIFFLNFIFLPQIMVNNIIKTHRGQKSSPHIVPLPPPQRQPQKLRTERCMCPRSRLTSPLPMNTKILWMDRWVKNVLTGFNF